MHPGLRLALMFMGIGTKLDREEPGVMRVLPNKMRMRLGEFSLQHPLEEKTEQINEKSCGELVNNNCMDKIYMKFEILEIYLYEINTVWKRLRRVMVDKG